jgi:hypothetical protein
VLFGDSAVGLLGAPPQKLEITNSSEKNPVNIQVIVGRTATADLPTAPTVASVTPAEGATGVLISADVKATFSEAMDEASVEAPGNFTLTKQGSTTPIDAAVSYDDASKVATLDPSADLDQEATYTATIKGGTNGVKDAAGNPLAQDKVWSITTNPPTPDEAADESG